jgi:hypothetical protein
MARLVSSQYKYMLTLKHIEKITGEKRKCLKCKNKKEQGNGNVFYCNACKPKLRQKYEKY